MLAASNIFAGLVVTPARSEITLEQNSSYDAAYTVKNGFDKTVKIDISVKNWNNSIENRSVAATDWLIVSDKSIVLEPEESKTINYSVKSGDLKGSLSGMISFTVKSPDYSGINLMTSVPVYMMISGTQNVSFDIEKIELKNIGVNNSMNVTFSVKNTGNVHIRLTGHIKILKEKDKDIISESKISELSPVYPDMSRQFFDAVKIPQKGKYILNISLNAYGMIVEKNIQIRVNKYGDITY